MVDGLYNDGGMKAVRSLEMCVRSGVSATLETCQGAPLGTPIQPSKPTRLRIRSNIWTGRRFFAFLTARQNTPHLCSLQDHFARSCYRVHDLLRRGVISQPVSLGCNPHDAPQWWGKLTSRPSLLRASNITSRPRNNSS